MSGIHAASRRGILSCAVAIAVALLAGCGSTTASGGTASSTSSPAAGSGTQASSGATITIKDFAFTTPASVSPGAKVRVNNMDGLAHTVTADSGHAFDSPAPAGNSSFTAPTTPGSYPFHCSIHPEMHGVLVVK
jgi:plastocyanin